MPGKKPPVTHVTITVLFERENQSGKSIRVKSFGGKYANIGHSYIRNYDLAMQALKDLPGVNQGKEMIIDIPEWLAVKAGLIVK